MPTLAPSERRSLRGISPVVDVSSLIATVALLAAMVGMMVMGFEDVLSEPRPQVSLDVDYHPDGADNGVSGAYINITHESGSLEDDSWVSVAGDANNRVAREDAWIGGEAADPAGEYIHIGGAGSDSTLRPICETGQRRRIVIEHEDESSSIFISYEIPTKSASKSTTC